MPSIPGNLAGEDICDLQRTEDTLVAQSTLRIMSVVGARPNMMKIAPFIHALKRADAPFEHILVHTGQHYDASMSGNFLETLGIPAPDTNLGIGSGSHAEQVGKTMMAFEKVVRAREPDWIVVVGDVNATCACAITAKKEHRRLAHIEAGLRSFDMEMPEEINRIVTDRLADLLFTPDTMAGDNLRKEGVPEERIKCVGNIMIDTLEKNRARAQALNLPAIVKANLLDKNREADVPRLSQGYAVLTLHRPSNVDDRAVLEPLIRYFCDDLAPGLPLLWTLHPRTKKHLEDFGLWKSVGDAPGVFLLEPLGYREMLRLNMDADIMFTDSGGLQEECCVLGTPCVTLRYNTERPVTLTEHGGVSVLTGNDIDAIRAACQSMRGKRKPSSRPPLWDGDTAARIVACLENDGGT